MTRQARARRAVTGALAVGCGSAVAVGLLAPAAGNASSHREAPYISTDPRADNTDVYAFVSPDDADTVTLVANWWPIEEPDGGPTFYRFGEGVAYDINIDTDADALPDLTYRWTFESSFQNPDTFLYNTGAVTSLDDENLNFRQTYDLALISYGTGVDGVDEVDLIADDAPVAPSYVGTASMPDYEALFEEAVLSDDSRQYFAGQSEDSFFLDLRVFDLLYGGDLSLTGNDTLDGYNVQTLAIQVPKDELALDGDAEANPVIGIWSTTSRQEVRTLATDGSGAVSTSGEFAQVSRLGSPLVNEVVVPVGAKDLFNASQPVNDERFLPQVNDPEVARLLNLLYGFDIPDTDDDQPGTQRADLVAVFLTGVADLTDPTINEDVDTVEAAELLRLNMSIAPSDDPDRLGRARRRPAGLPERSPSGRRRRRHRAAGRRGRAARGGRAVRDPR